MPQIHENGFKRLKIILQMLVALHFACMLVNYKTIVYNLCGNEAVCLQKCVF